MTRLTSMRLLLVLAALATTSSPALAESGLLSTEGAIEELVSRQSRGNDVLVVQSELDPIIRQGGGGACASSAAIDAVQALRLMAGAEPVLNPHKAALAAITRQDELLNGRVTNAQMTALLLGYAEEHLRDWDLQVEVATTPHGPYSAKATAWEETEGPDFDGVTDGLRIVTFTVTKESGKLLGRHFVLLKRLQGTEISVLDPSRPTKSTTYTVSPREIENFGRRVFLVPPPKAKSTDTFEVDAVFTLHLKKRESPARAPDALTSLQSRIDETAEALAASGDLRSPRRWREVSAAFGLPGLDLPTEYGGSNWSASRTLEAFIFASRHDLNCRDIVGGAHARPLLKSSHAKVKEIIRQVARGDAYMAITMTEPHAGSDFHAITSTARKVDGGYLLSGEKRYVARLDQATHVIIFTQPSSGKPEGLSAFVLPIDTPGLDRYSFRAHGLKGNSFGGMRFKDVRVEDWQMIGSDGQGDDIFVDHFRYWRLMQVAAALGTAERALEMMVDRLIEREAFGAPIGRFSHLQQAVGQHTTELRMAKALAREAAGLLDRNRGAEADAIINGLKAEGVEIALATVDSAVRAFGAEGYSENVDLGARLQDLNGLRIADGTTDVMRMSVVQKSYGDKGKRLWDLAVKGKK